MFYIHEGMYADLYKVRDGSLIVEYISETELWLSEDLKLILTVKNTVQKLTVVSEHQTVTCLI